MKKYVGILLLISLATSVPMQAQIQEQIKARWNSLKSHFDREVKEFNRCVIERRKDCDPLRQKVYITAGILLTLLTVWGIKKGVKQYRQIPMLHTQEMTALDEKIAQTIESVEIALLIANAQISDPNTDIKDTRQLFLKQQEAKTKLNEAQQENNKQKKLELLNAALNAFD